MSTPPDARVLEVPVRPSKVYFSTLSVLHCAALFWCLSVSFVIVIKMALTLLLGLNAWVCYRHWRGLARITGLRVQGGDLLLLSDRGETVVERSTFQPVVCNPLLIIFKCARGSTFKQLPIFFDSVKAADMRRLTALPTSD